METKQLKGTVVVDQHRCKGCDLCVVSCPTQTLSLHPTEVNEKGYSYCYMSSPTTCIACTNCAVVCPDGCISVYRAPRRK